MELTRNSTALFFDAPADHKPASLMGRLTRLMGENSDIVLGEYEAITRALHRSQAIIEFDPDGCIRAANPNFLAAVGYSFDEIDGKHHRIFVEPDYAGSSDYAAFWTKLRGGEFVSGEFARRRKNGSRLWLQATYNPITNADGKVVKIIKFATDITDEKLRNADYRGQIEGINQAQAVIEFAPDGTILTANGNFLSVMGYRLDEIVGQHHRIFVDRAYAATPEYKAFWDKLGRGQSVSQEFRRIARNGSDVWIQATYSPIFDPDGRLFKVVKFATDITKQKIQTSQDRGLVQAIQRSQAVIAFDIDGIILEANDNFLNTVGYQKSEIVGQHHRMFVDPDYARSQDYARFWEQLRGGEFHTGEYRRIGKGGREIWLRATYNPIFGPDGSLQKVVKFAEDISGQVEARKQLELLSLVANETDNAVLITDARGITQYVNPGFVKMSGFPEQQIIGRKPGDMLQGPATDPKTRQEIREKLRENVPFYKEILNYTASGAPHWISLSINPVRGPSGKVERFVSINADVTETKTRALEFNTRIQAIERANAAVEWDPTGHVKRANMLATDLFGTADLKELDELLALGTVLGTKDEEHLRAGNSFVRDVALHSNAGNDVFLSGVFVPVSDYKGDIVSLVMYATDTTKRRQSVAQAHAMMQSVLSEIQAISQEIASVSVQTKLLSLNAGVEAARAGEAGRGFAIVAQEVRTLAEQTTRSMKKVDELLKQTRIQISDLSKDN